MDQLPGLRVIANFGVGFDAIDVPAATARGITVTNTPEVLNDDVADLAVALLLAESRRMVAADVWTRAGNWPQGEFPLARKMSGRRIGVLGLGRIGREIADRLAAHVDFFSIGTNDLTQTTLGISRDDAGSFLPDYQRTGILEHDPFVTIDVEGVGEMVKIAAERGRATRPDIKLGICGEHGGDPASVHFCETVGLDYVSCSPYRVPIARLAAAQAALSTEQTNRD